MKKYDVIVIGAGAAGTMCGIESAKRGRKTLLIEHNKQIGNKILISGGGRCNFANIGASHQNFISQNEHFMKSALSRYTQYDFISLVESHKIEYYEKTLGQLFCKKSSKEIINMLLSESKKAGLEIITECKVFEIKKNENGGYFLRTQNDEFICDSLVIATGGLSFPNRGATNFSYQIAEQFDLDIVKLRPGLVPLKLDINKNLDFESISGVSFFANATCNGVNFKESLLFTHKGLSGPVILQISNYWNSGDKISINIEPDKNIKANLLSNLKSSLLVKNFLGKYLPAKFADIFCDYFSFNKPIKSMNSKEIDNLISTLENWEIYPVGTEGYKKAEITLGGINTNELSSKTFETKKHSGLFFIGEALDVSGWLGGYNFTWAWSCGWAAGQYV
ncbi:NAD(P)/FAD-dependent oxidoreductase [Candidatus Kapabacteria bacterium]|nr:NAD(P)/FAD-dependent oxidoreductase [Candidatus Kapabacteria bacterium]